MQTGNDWTSAQRAAGRLNQTGLDGQDVLIHPRQRKAKSIRGLAMKMIFAQPDRNNLRPSRGDMQLPDRKQTRPTDDELCLKKPRLIRLIQFVQQL